MAEKIIHRKVRCRDAAGRAHPVARAFLTVLLLFVIVMMTGCGGSGPEKIGESVPTGGMSESRAPAEEASEPEQVQEEQPSVFSVGDQVSLDDIVVTLMGVTTSMGKNYMEPGEGNEFILCEFEIENRSSSDITVSSLLSFDAYVDEYSTSMSFTATVATDRPKLDGTVAAGKKMNGVIGYEASKDWGTIEIRFTPDFWKGKEIVFQAFNG